MHRTLRRCKTPFGPWLAAEADLRAIDAGLLLVLRMQPSEIDDLEMDDYFQWAETAAEVLRQRERAAGG